MNVLKVIKIIDFDNVFHQPERVWTRPSSVRMKSAMILIIYFMVRFMFSTLEKVNRMNIYFIQWYFLLTSKETQNESYVFLMLIEKGTP